MISICCVGFASLVVVCDELNNCAWNLVAWVCLVCLLVYKEEGSSSVSAITERMDMGLYEVPCCCLPTLLTLVSGGDVQ